MYFWFGWLTLGILWYIGALARKPGQPAHPPKAVVAVLAGAAVAFLVLGLFGARPAPVLGLDGQALQRSVGSPGLPGETGSGCERQPDGTWRCLRHDEGFSGTVLYAVRVNGRGCWQADRVGSPGEGSPKRLRGCVTLVDFVI
jgi:hypothetical protein